MNSIVLYLLQQIGRVTDCRVSTLHNDDGSIRGWILVKKNAEPLRVHELRGGKLVEQS